MCCRKVKILCTSYSFPQASNVGVSGHFSICHELTTMNVLACSPLLPSLDAHNILGMSSSLAKKFFSCLALRQCSQPTYHHYLLLHFTAPLCSFASSNKQAANSAPRNFMLILLSLRCNTALVDSRRLIRGSIHGARPQRTKT